ncbi:MFS transporter [Pyrobaculum calidifontis]|uniref:Major facilitator superfamily MFS_1 n=1 Tax=Pyrobaculum calidifontis (strain DSM 21063 / JCM 11548 / VA1) TaxID=410359 RepID=A3MT90_PYRCJ|nr:MFS transporter [Pyrobaculum calidifontis]ABO07857.1 major facilitator superfamily MFS_1 [Pyrobaculum calidifontis JCM 11548]
MRRVVAVVGVARFVRYFILGHLAVSLPIALEASAGGAAGAGAVLSLAGLISLGASIAYSVVGDVVRHARGLAISETAFALGLLALAHVKNPWLLALALGLGGMGTLGPGATRGAFVPLILAVIRDHSKSHVESAKAIGVVNSISTLGGILGSATAGFTDLRHSIPPYSAVALGTALLIAVALGRGERVRAVNPLKRVATRGREVAGYSLSQFVAGVGIGLSMPLLSLWLHAYMGLDEATIGLIFAVGNGAFMVSSLFAYRLVEALGLVRAAVVSRVASGMLLASLPIFREVVPFAVAFVFYNAAVGIGGTARSSYISSVAPVGSEATTPAVSNIAIRASSVPSVALSGYIMELEPAAAMPLAGLMLIAAGAIMWKMLKEPEEFTH